MTSRSSTPLRIHVALAAWICLSIGFPTDVRALEGSTSEQVPVIFVPGIGGSKLRDPRGGRVLWGNARSLFWPRDGGYRLALPLDDLGPPDGVGALEPFATVLQVRLLGFLKKEAYGAVQRSFEARGYRSGDLADPTASDSFFFLVYDWRRSIVDGAAELTRRLEALRSVRGDRALEVDLVCQSTAALLCRWFAKYGDASLEEVENAATGGGQATSQPTSVRVRNLVLLGTANGGALRTFQEVHLGRRYLPFGRNIRPEVMFSWPSVYESLPVDRRRPFFDASGAPLEVDLFSAGDWKTYGFAAFSGPARKRLDRPRAIRRFGDESQRLTFLARRLDRAQRVHDALMRDPDGWTSPRYHSLQNAFEPTLDRTLMRFRGDRSEVRFPPSREYRRDPWLESLALLPGDGHATRGSQDRISVAEKRALESPPIYIQGSHFEFILDPSTQRELARILSGP